MLHTIHNSSQLVTQFLMRILINCGAFWLFPPIFFPCYWNTNSIHSFVYTTLKAHSLFLCMPYYVLSSALLLLTLLPPFQNQSRKSSCCPWYHSDNICLLLQNLTRLKMKDFVLVTASKYIIWIAAFTFNSSIPQQDPIQHPFYYIPS